MASVLKSCLEQILVQLKPVEDDGTFRELAIRQSPAIDAAAFPAIHVIPGDETADNPDVCGYSCTRQILIKITFSDFRDPFGMAADLVAAVQTAVESDTELGGRCKTLQYRGEQPFITDATKPRAGTFLIYDLVYRRKQAQPDVSY